MVGRIEFKSEAGRNAIFNIFVEHGISELDFCDDWDNVKKRLYPPSSNNSLGFIICKALHYQTDRKNVQLLERAIYSEKLLYINLYEKCVCIIQETPTTVVDTTSVLDLHLTDYSINLEENKTVQNQSTQSDSLHNQDSLNTKESVLDESFHLEDFIEASGFKDDLDSSVSNENVQIEVLAANQHLQFKEPDLRYPIKRDIKTKSKK